jgi:hypothetical protein
MAAHNFDIRSESGSDTWGRTVWSVRVPNGAVPDAERAVDALSGVIAADPDASMWFPESVPDIVTQCQEARKG